MKACLWLLCLWAGLILTPFLTLGQSDIHPAAYTYNDQGNTISSNVPLNEISSHAWRHFHRIFSTANGDENWFYSAQGYIVSFSLSGHAYQAYFDPHGYYRYSLHHYAGKEIPREPGDIIKRKYPEYQLNIVTEISNGEKIVYLVRLVSPTRIKTVSYCEGDFNVINEQAIDDPAATAATTSRQSYP